MQTTLYRCASAFIGAQLGASMCTDGTSGRGAAPAPAPGMRRAGTDLFAVGSVAAPPMAAGSPYQRALFGLAGVARGRAWAPAAALNPASAWRGASNLACGPHGPGSSPGLAGVAPLHVADESKRLSGPQPDGMNRRWRIPPRCPPCPTNRRVAARAADQVVGAAWAIRSTARLDDGAAAPLAACMASCALQARASPVKLLCLT